MNTNQNISAVFFFSLKKVPHVAVFREMTAERRGAARTSATAIIFSSPLNYPHVLFKGANVFTLAHTNSRYFSSILKPRRPRSFRRPIWRGLIPPGALHVVLQQGGLRAWLRCSCEASSGDISIIPD